jgi:16S rRNA (adenine(1408)-N(1))-methyltransferase
MEYINGKKTGQMDGPALAARLRGYSGVGLDLGTGDGRYIERLARQDRQRFFIGVDACRENLQRVSGRAGGNLLFLIANVETLPLELSGLADLITLNFPWGSLLEGLFQAESRLIANLQMVAKKGARLELRLNESALRQAGWAIETAGPQVVTALAQAGFTLEAVQSLEAAALQSFPSTWAKRLASGKAGQTLCLSGRYSF